MQLINPLLAMMSDSLRKMSVGYLHMDISVVL